MAYFNELNIPNERTLAAFQKLEVNDFSKPLFTIKNLGLPDLAYEDYLYLFLSHKATTVAESPTGLGLFAAEDIEPDSPIMEYCGERISPRRAQLRAINYRRDGIAADCMSDCDSTTVIDATFAGNKARYLNHSCRPNVILDAVTLDN